MNRIGFIGHLMSDKQTTSGQIIKARIIRDELFNHYSKKEIYIIDTHGGFLSIPLYAIKSFSAFLSCKNIVFLPAYKGILFFVPLFVFLNVFFHRKLHYITIGGWLGEYLQKHKLIKSLLKRIDYIYVESMRINDELNSEGFKNIVVMKNFKRLTPVCHSDIRRPDRLPLKVCTFSRVMKEKGIEDAIDSVTDANGRLKEKVYSLDIYGQIDPQYEERFFALIKDKSDYVQYKGIVPYDKTCEVLKNYFALLFPTYYSGEGMPGTLIDAMAAGLPVIASRWKDIPEIVKDNVNGVLFPIQDTNILTEILIQAHTEIDKWTLLRESSRKEYEKYTPELVLNELTNRLA